MVSQHLVNDKMAFVQTLSNVFSNWAKARTRGIQFPTNLEKVWI